MTINGNMENDQQNASSGSESGAANLNPVECTAVVKELMTILQPICDTPLGPKTLLEGMERLLQMVQKTRKEDDQREYKKQRLCGSTSVLLHFHITKADEKWNDVLQAAAKSFLQDNRDSETVSTNLFDERTVRVAVSDTAAPIATIEKSAQSDSVSLGTSAVNNTSITSETPASSASATLGAVTVPPSTVSDAVVPRTFDGAWRPYWRVGSRVDVKFYGQDAMPGTVTRTNFSAEEDHYDVRLENGDEVLNLHYSYVHTPK